MDKNELVRQIIADAGGVAKTEDFNKQGVYNYEIVRLVDDGVLDRVRHGYYELADNPLPNEEQVIAKLFPDGIVCHYSALFHYGYSDRTPSEWHIAFPRTVSRSRLALDYPPITPYFVKDELFDLGKTTSTFQGFELPVYDRERIICDCFKRRNRMDAELFNKAVIWYMRDSKKDIARLTEYAEKLRVRKAVYDVMGVLVDA